MLRSSPRPSVSKLVNERQVDYMVTKLSHRLRLVVAVVAIAAGCAPTSPPPVLDWHARPTTVMPSPRNGVGMVYDSDRHVTIVYGGYNPNSNSMDAWEWNGSTWTKNAALGVTYGGFVGLAYDSARQRLVRYTGNVISEFDGTSWVTKTPTTRPPSRQVVTMTYDAARQRVVMFGGLNFTPSPLADTWEWDGTNWQQRVTATSPPARSYHAMAYDTARQRVVMFGGGASGAIYNDTWEYDGTNWIQRFPTTSPPPDDGHNLAYDIARQRTILLASSGDTWEWDGTNWTKQAPLTAPGGRAWFGMAYDQARSATVVFGGYNSSGYRSDTWEYSSQ